MRAPLSWLSDFAPFPNDPALLAATLDDLGLVVESTELVGEGLTDVVVARVDEINPIKGADRIRLVTIEAGQGPMEIVCGATNFAVGDLVPLAPVGAVLPGGFAITSRKMRGVVSNGMLCSGRELNLSQDHDGLLLIEPTKGVGPGTPLTVALGIEPDVVFDIAVEGNRPDAWSMVGIARDLAARLQLPFSELDPTVDVHDDDPVGSLASLTVDAPALCPRMTVTVLRGVTVGPSPQLLARRLTMAGMRPINNVVDASNYVMLELGQPTHPYDLNLLPGRGLRVRQAHEGETIETLDGVTRTVGTPGRGLADNGEDCLICDATDTPVGIAGVMGGASSEISDTTTDVLLEAAYFAPMAIARTSKRLGLRSEASARFERGVDPEGLDRAAARFVQLLAQSMPAGSLTRAQGMLDARGPVPTPLDIEVPLVRINGLLGSHFNASQVASLLVPLGFSVVENGDAVLVGVPTNRPDIRPAPFGIEDVIEEVARAHSYSKLDRHQPTWPAPGHLNDRQRFRRQVKEIMCGLGHSEAWTKSFLEDADHGLIGLTGPAVALLDPLVSTEAVLRRTMMPGLLRALAYNADRRQGMIRLFEVGVVFSHPALGHGRAVERSGAGGVARAVLPGERELLSAVFADPADDATSAVSAWHVLAETLGLVGVRLVNVTASSAVIDEAAAGLHPTRAAYLMSRDVILGAVGEIDPAVADLFGTHEPGISGSAARVGWLCVDLGLLADHDLVERRDNQARPISRFPSSDIDLAFVVGDAVAATEVLDALAQAGGELLESVRLFDVYRGPPLDEGTRSLAYRLRFCAQDRTLTDAEVGECRMTCIAAATGVGATLR